MLQRSFATAVVLLVATPLLAAELTPLEIVVAKEQSQATSYYTLKRCSAVYTAYAAMVADDDKASYMTEPLLKSAETFAMLVFMYEEKFSMHQSQEDMAKDIEKITMLYVEDMNNAYYASGNRTDGVSGKDVGFCKGLLDQFNAGR